MTHFQSFLNALAVFLAIYQLQSKRSRLELQKKPSFKKKRCDPFLWMGFNCLNAIEPLRGHSLLLEGETYLGANCHLKFSELLSWTLSNSSWFFLCVCAKVLKTLIKPSHCTETKICVKLDSKTANTACSYHLKSGTTYSKWN